mmetsp:Transcript_117015/g.303409  ORF Transcript_117015/g.303409 Transcript_117015/m.303409 type:complete len:118 (+) Transcript_117015:1747-2100(+)
MLGTWLGGCSASSQASALLGQVAESLVGARAAATPLRLPVAAVAAVWADSKTHEAPAADDAVGLACLVLPGRRQGSARHFAREGDPKHGQKVKAPTACHTVRSSDSAASEKRRCSGW